MDNGLIQALKGLPFWDILDSREQGLLEENAIIETYNKQEQVNHSGEECKGPIVVLDGQIRTYIVSDEGREVTLYRLYKGDTCALSASCLMKSIIFDVIIEAVEETKVLVIPSRIFHMLQEKNPQLEIYLLRISNERFSDVMGTMQRILFMGADQRVAIYLWDEISKTGNMNLKVTHDEIARFIGSAREVVTRVLKYFAKEEIIKLSRGKIEILDKEKLKAFV